MGKGDGRGECDLSLQDTDREMDTFHICEHPKLRALSPDHTLVQGGRKCSFSWVAMCLAKNLLRSKNKGGEWMLMEQLVVFRLSRYV